MDMAPSVNIICPDCDGPWGANSWCAGCTDLNGTPRPRPRVVAVVNWRATATVVVTAALSFIAGLTVATTLIMATIMEQGR